MVEGERIAIHQGGKDGGIFATATVARIVGLTDEELNELPEEELALLEQQEEAGHVRGPLCWILKDVHRVEPPMPCKGKLGLWKPSAAVAQELRARGITSQE